jgi:hypothetical protein
MSTRVERRVKLWRMSLAYTPAALFALLLPKCPLCIAAPLALLGVTIPLPSYAKALVVGLSVAVASVFVVMRRKGRASCSNCQVSAPTGAR